jgi:alpha-glucosidase
MLVGEIWLADPERFARYLRPDELHTAFNFDLMGRPWDAAALRDSIRTTLAAHAPVDAPATWVLSNHDVTRPVTRYGRADTSFAFDTKRFGVPTDLELGTRRARAAALLTGALPGSLYIYQGDELGLPEVEDLPTAALQDPIFYRSEGTDPGRDGCRVPLPWTTIGSTFGFNSHGFGPWLPQAADWGSRSVEAQAGDPESMLSLYRSMLAARKDLDESFAWHPLNGEDLLAFIRGDVLCLVNFGAPRPLPTGSTVLLASAPLTGKEGVWAPPAYCAALDTAPRRTGSRATMNTASRPSPQHAELPRQAPARYGADHPDPLHLPTDTAAWVRLQGE